MAMNSKTQHEWLLKFLPYEGRISDLRTTRVIIPVFDTTLKVAKQGRDYSTVLQYKNT